MSCDLCKDIADRQDVPHVVRICEGCGREMHVVELGDHGRGIKVEKGDRVVIPHDWLQMSLNPLKSRGTFTRSGVQWFAEQIFVSNLFGKQAEFEDELKTLEDWADRTLQASPLVAGYDITNPEHAERILDIVKDNRESAAWWGALIGLFLSVSRDALADGQPNRALWALACAERARAMLVFKEQLEEVVWMGHSAKRLIDILTTWDNNRLNDDEEFWQLTFNENSYVLSQVFAVPMVFIKDKAYVGGMKLDRGRPASSTTSSPRSHRARLPLSR